MKKFAMIALIALAPTAVMADQAAATKCRGKLNKDGKAINVDGRIEKGLYAVGWIKRGPSGVIGTNKKDATETVELLLADAGAGLLPSRGDGDIVDALSARGARPVSYAGWEAIDAVERARGEEQGRPRVKLCRWDELLAAAESLG